MAGANQAQLRVFIDNQYFRDFTLTSRTLILGSDTHADLYLNHRHISRQHLKFEFYKGQFFVTDMNSTNGAEVNGQRLHAGDNIPLSAGDSISIANTIRIEFTFTGLAETEYTAPLTPSSPIGVTTGLSLSADNTPVTLKDSTTLNIKSTSDSLQHVSVSVPEIPDSVEISIVPQEQFVPPNTAVNAQVRVKRKGLVLFGGEYPITFVAQSQSGLFARLDTYVQLQPRYEILLALIIFLIGFTGMVVAASQFFNPNAVTTATLTITDTSSPTPTDTPSLLPTNSPTEPATSTATITSTDSPTPTTTFTPTTTVTPTVTSSATVTPSPTVTPSLTVTSSATVTPSATPSLTPPIIISPQVQLITAVPLPPRPLCNCTAFGYRAYQVQSNDTVLRISQRYNISIPTILSLNRCITDANIIIEGETLCLPYAYYVPTPIRVPGRPPYPVIIPTSAPPPTLCPSTVCNPVPIPPAPTVICPHPIGGDCILPPPTDTPMAGG